MPKLNIAKRVCNENTRQIARQQEKGERKSRTTATCVWMTDDVMFADFFLFSALNTSPSLPLARSHRATHCIYLLLNVIFAFVCLIFVLDYFLSLAVFLSPSERDELYSYEISAIEANAALSAE